MKRNLQLRSIRQRPPLQTCSRMRLKTWMDQSKTGIRSKERFESLAVFPVQDFNASLTISNKAQHSQYSYLDVALLENEKKTGDLRRRSKQAVLHLTFTEMRITQMEQQIRKLEAELHNKPDDFQLSVARRQAPTFKSFIKHSSHGEFLLTPQSVDIPTNEQASLEVLVADHGTSATLGPDQHSASLSTSVGQSQQTPERLRIRYPPLIKTLEKVCRERLSNSWWFTEGKSIADRPVTAPTVLLRPWKLLIAYEKQIRDSIDNIDAFVEPVRRGNVSGGVAETGVIQESEYYPS